MVVPIRHFSDGGSGGALSAVPSDPRTDTAVRRAVAEGSADMTGRTDGQPDERAGGSAVGPGKRLPVSPLSWIAHMWCNPVYFQSFTARQLRPGANIAKNFPAF